MTPRPFPRCVFLFVWLFAALLAPAALYAQVTPAAGYTPPDDTPSIKVGATIFADYTYNKDPVTKDADGNGIHADSFNVSRAYINITGNISHMIAFRITPDITRENGHRRPLSAAAWFPAEVRVRPVQPRRLDDARVVGPLRHPADALRGLHGRHLSVSLPGHDVHRARGVPDLVGRGRVVPLQLPEELRRHPRRGTTTATATASRKPTTSRRSRSEARCGPSRRQPPVSAACASPASTTATTTSRTTRRPARCSRRPSSTSTSTPGYDYLHTTDQTTAAVPLLTGNGYSFWFTPKTTIGHRGAVPLRPLHAERRLRRPERRSHDRRRRVLVQAPGQRQHCASCSTTTRANFTGSCPPQPRQTKIALHGLVNF